MYRETINRRTVLRTTGGIGIISGLTGCLGGNPISSLRGGSPSFADWLYEPGSVIDVDHYSIEYYNISPFVKSEDEFDKDIEIEDSSLELVDLDFDDLSGFLSFYYRGPAILGARVLFGSFDLEEISEELEEQDFDDSSSQSNFEIFSRDYTSEIDLNAVGVSESALICGFDEEYVETLIETSIGENDRYQEESEDFNELLAALQGGDYIRGYTREEESQDNPEYGLFKDLVAYGMHYRIRGETSDIRHVLVFEDERDADTDDVEEWVSESDDRGETFDDVDDPTIKASKRVIRIDGTIDTDDI